MSRPAKLTTDGGYHSLANILAQAREGLLVSEVHNGALSTTAAAVAALTTVTAATSATTAATTTSTAATTTPTAARRRRGL